MELLPCALASSRQFDHFLRPEAIGMDDLSGTGLKSSAPSQKKRSVMFPSLALSCLP